MSKQAKITSVKALDTFRAAVVQFRTAATRALSGVSQDVQRVQHWVSSEQISTWRVRVRKGQAAVDNARSDLERARLGRPNDTAQMFFEQRKALEKARRSQREAEERLQLLKKWGRRLDHEVMLMRSGLQPISNLLEADMELLLARLAVLARHLDAYLKLPAPPTDFDDWAKQIGEPIGLFGRDGSRSSKPKDDTGSDPDPEEESVDA